MQPNHRRTLFLAAIPASMMIAVAVLYLRSAPSCGSNEALRKLDAVLRDRFHLDSIYINDVETQTGGWLATRHTCAAEITEIKGNADAKDLPWRSVSFTIAKDAASNTSGVTAELGGPVPLAPARSFWQRLVARL